MHSLADRYRDRQGGYLRIVRKGYNASGSDRAPKAIVELVNNPYDLVYGEAKLFGNRVLKQLRDVEGLKYKREAMKLQDPMTGKEVDVFKLTERVEMAGKERRKLTLREVGIHKRLIRMRQSLISYPMARKAEHRNSHLIPPSEFRERQLKLQREVREVRRYHRKPSPKFRETISQHGFMVNSRYKVVPMPGVVQPLALSPGSTSATLGYIRKAPRKKALASGTLTKATAPSDATLSNKAGTNVQHDKPAKPEEDQSFTQKMLSRMGFGRFYSGRSKK
ncbi:hypothetical protein BSLG_005294 [Batrachochytrium salamandrivorans]|nr:hypothetical protein BSLG_005294 [Batrachochytrium salamandrivorans]